MNEVRLRPSSSSSSSSSLLLLITPTTSSSKFPSRIATLHFQKSPLTQIQATFSPPKISHKFQHEKKKKKKKNNKPFKFTSKKTHRKFLEKDAFPESLPLHTKNPSAIYKDLQRLASEGKLKEALVILDYLDQKGIAVNPTTFSALLASCVRSKSLSYGREFHTHIRINNLEDNEFLRTKLVSMYTSCGSIEDAHKLFDEIPTQPNSVYPWNALLRGNVVCGGRRHREVLSTYTEMRQLGIDLNEYTFTCLIKSFAGSSTFTEGLKAHALLIKNGFGNGSILIQTTLIDMYFKCGKIKLARRVFEEMAERDIVVWGTMIAGFIHNKLKREALEYLRWMLSEGIIPNSVILTTILPVIGELMGAWKLGREVHGFVIKTKSYSKQLFIQSGLIDMYCKSKDMGSARQVFYCSAERNAVSWTALMSGYASNGRLDQALRSIIWMQQERVKPDVVTVATVLPVCAELKALRQGKEIHGYVVKHEFLPNVSISTSLMTMYSRCGNIEYSSKLFEVMEKKNVISWTAMMDSFLKNRCLDEALAVFRSMQLSKHRPDSVAISRTLVICGELGALKLGKEIHGHILKKSFESIPFVSAEVVRMYGKCGEIEKAQVVFDRNPSKGSMTWNAIIQAYGDNDRYQDALDLFEWAGSKGFSPNHLTFKVLLSICDRAEFVDKAKKIFNSMVKRYNAEPTEEHYSIIIGLLTRTGQSKDAERFINMKSLLS